MSSRRYTLGSYSARAAKIVRDGERSREVVPHLEGLFARQMALGAIDSPLSKENSVRPKHLCHVSSGLASQEYQSGRHDFTSHFSNQSPIASWNACAKVNPRAFATDQIAASSVGVRRKVRTILFVSIVTEEEDRSVVAAVLPGPGAC
jgi:hypothetical protein